MALAMTAPGRLHAGSAPPAPPAPIEPASPPCAAPPPLVTPPTAAPIFEPLVAVAPALASAGVPAVLELALAPPPSAAAPTSSVRSEDLPPQLTATNRKAQRANRKAGLQFGCLNAP